MYMLTWKCEGIFAVQKIHSYLDSPAMIVLWWQVLSFGDRKMTTGMTWNVQPVFHTFSTCIPLMWVKQPPLQRGSHSGQPCCIATQHGAGGIGNWIQRGSPYQGPALRRASASRLHHPKPFVWYRSHRLLWWCYLDVGLMRWVLPKAETSIDAIQYSTCY